MPVAGVGRSLCGLCLSGNGCATLKWHKLCAICGTLRAMKLSMTELLHTRTGVCVCMCVHRHLYR